MYAHDSNSREATEEALAQRMNPLHLRQRLGIERDREALVFGQGTNFFHIENWYSMHSFIRSALRACLLYGRGRRNALRIRTRHHHITPPRLPRSFEGFTLLHLSDLHLDMTPHSPDALIERVATLDYDVAVITGDFRARTVGPWEPAVDALSQVRAHLKEPVFGVLGNHDSIHMVPAMEAMGIRMLLNESVSMTRGGEHIHLAGIDDPHYFRADNLEKACEGIPLEATSVLLAHSPEIYRHAAHAGFDVMLCGHTHGGQICLPGGFALTYNARCPRRLCAGAWTYHELAGYTSVGSGACIVDARFNCPPEITLHHLHAP